MRALAVTVAIWSSLPAFAWGPEGHSLVARLAAAHLTPQATARVAEVLGQGNTMQSIASWADQIRRERLVTGPWHYVDIPIDKPHLDMTRDCPKGDCVIAKIEEFQRTVVDPAATPVQRREALLFLIHFVGDMHQPLHCSDNKDKGGNDVKLDLFGRPTNLHSAWDGGLLARIGQEDALFAKLSKDLTDRRASKWGKGSVSSWGSNRTSLHRRWYTVSCPKLRQAGRSRWTPRTNNCQTG